MFVTAKREQDFSKFRFLGTFCVMPCAATLPSRRYTRDVQLYSPNWVIHAWPRGNARDNDGSRNSVADAAAVITKYLDEPFC
jgi:hypothetical protein